MSDGKTLSLKTTIKRSNKVCPQKIGQPTRKRFKEYFNIDPEQLDPFIKCYIISNVDYFINRWENLWCCDYLLWLYKDNNEWNYKFFDERMLNKSPFTDSKKFTFTQKVESWKKKEIMYH